MKVLFVCRESPFHGISPIMKRQGESLNSKGIEVHYYAVEGKGFFGYFKSVFKLRNYLKMQDKFDIVHAHYGLCGFVASYAVGNEKTVISFMGTELLWHDTFSMMDIMVRQINNRCIRKFDAIVVKSMEMSKVLGRKKHYVIPNGVSLNDFFYLEQQVAREKIGYHSKKKLIIFISDPPGREEKNYPLLESAIRLIDDPSIEVKCLSGLTKEELNCFYSAADLLVLTSLHEGSPNVIKEAMACGCPIVSTDVGDVRNNMEGVEGCYITSFDPVDVAAKIKLAVSFGRTEGRSKLISLELDSDSSSDKVIKVYREITAK